MDERLGIYISGYHNVYNDNVEYHPLPVPVFVSLFFDF